VVVIRWRDWAAMDSTAVAGHRALEFHSTGVHTKEDRNEKRRRWCMDQIRRKRSTLIHAARMRTPGAGATLRSELRAALRTPFEASGGPVPSWGAGSSAAAHYRAPSALEAAAALAAAGGDADAEVDRMVARCLHDLDVELQERERLLLAELDAMEDHEARATASLVELVGGEAAGGAAGPPASSSSSSSSSSSVAGGVLGGGARAHGWGAGAAPSMPDALRWHDYGDSDDDSDDDRAGAGAGPAAAGPAAAWLGCGCPSCGAGPGLRCVGAVALCGCGFRFDMTGGARPQELPELLLAATAGHGVASPGCAGRVGARVVGASGRQTLFVGCAACRWSEVVA